MSLSLSIKLHSFDLTGVSLIVDTFLSNLLGDLKVPSSEIGLFDTLLLDLGEVIRDFLIWGELVVVSLGLSFSMLLTALT